jgi:hypothetical protein
VPEGLGMLAKDQAEMYVLDVYMDGWVDEFSELCLLCICLAVHMDDV